MNILKTIREHSEITPDRIAVRTGNDQLTYRELWELSDRLADWLLANHPSPREPVPVYGHKSPLMIVCFLGCVKAGCAYCPIDTSVPSQRVEAILQSLTSELVLAVEPLHMDSCAKAVANVRVDRHRLKLSFDDRYTVPDAWQKEAEVPAQSAVCTKQTAENVEVSEDSSWVFGSSTFYIIFTSGSTGTPKGVQISADCLNHFLEWSITFVKIPDGMPPVFLNQAPFSFDLSVMDLYTCLAVGGTLICLTKTVQTDYALLMEAFGASQASVWVSTPSFADMCLSEQRFCEKLLPRLRTFLFCGETLANRTVRKLQERFLNAEIYNTYGPTESTVAVTQVLVTPELNTEKTPLPVGCPRPGTLLEIVDENQNLLPEGEKGEIIILGDTVSTGYYHAPELTQKAFFKKPAPENSTVLRGYRTGDRGYLKDGMLYYCGRIDLQIKLHGYRIELEDIENNLRKIPGIFHAVVLCNYRNGKVSSLTAFVEVKEIPADKKAASAGLRKKLAAFLPDYMIPKKINFLEQMPMTRNGKADRRLLEEQL